MLASATPSESGTDIDLRWACLSSGRFDGVDRDHDER